MSLCEDCKFATAIEGSPLCRCEHPEVGALIDAQKLADPEDTLVLTALLFHGLFQRVMSKLSIEAKLEYARSGRFYWPVNFDPEALLKCLGREQQPLVTLN